VRIVYLVDSLKAGGKERQLVYLIEQICKKADVTIIVFSDEIFYTEVLGLPVRVYTVSKSNKFNIKTLVAVYRELKKTQPHVVHSWENISTLLVMPYLVLNPRTKLVSSIRYAGKLKRSLMQWIVKLIVHGWSCAIVSNSRQGLVVENLLGSKKGNVIYNGIDLLPFDTYKLIVSQFLEFKNRVIMVGRFYGAKDYITFIDAAKLVLEKNANTCFVCVGDGANRLAAEDAAGEYLNKTIFFIGERNDIPALLREMTIGVLLNNTNGHAEGISNSIMEYMAARIPVIATDAGGTPELVVNGLSGYLVPAFNKEIVADKIEYLINNSATSSEMGLNGRTIIENRFSLQKMLQSYLTLYQSVCRGVQ